MKLSVLFGPTTVGEIRLDNRIVMAPMTRNRGSVEGDATELQGEYYAHRATAGLIVSESIPVSAQGVGYPLTAGLFADSHVTSWSRVVERVHAVGGKIFAQLQHCGRISHPSLQPNGTVPVAPSAIAPMGMAVTYEGFLDFVVPHALGADEIPDIVRQFRSAAARAREAGFDGIEVHAANGYLLDQFLRDGSNKRFDYYGGTIKNRMRLLGEVLDAVSQEWPSSRVGVRLTPENSFNSMSDSNPVAHFAHVMERLSERGLAYVHVLEGDMLNGRRAIDYAQLRRYFRGTYIANNGYNLESGTHAVTSGHADLVAFGTPFIANPDLVARWREGHPLAAADTSTFYTGGATGYIDYPMVGKTGPTR
ncbi:alkene reductase [Dyella japonica]|uniref:NADH:flavin oxidoreductase n=1 Tax=Dyella japonica A8 TaxID=1217721 RepID=A0A075JVJ4_9GAMM|nr:alkene reductase [Dyella japonica]AIF46111.1 NADH:flavin oxidoreductase [Dyella japonica A8]